MPAESVVLAAAALFAGLGAEDAGRIAGVVVNGAAGEPVPGVEVVLRAGLEGEFVPVAETRTDRQGRFHFDDAPVEPGLVYLAGANHQGVHYPGSRIQLSPQSPAAEVKLTVYDAIAAPSPLIAEEYELEVRIETGFLEVTETLRVANPTTAAYVGEAAGDMPPVTLRLAIPAGFERVTFYDEFHGRRFHVAGGYVATDIPWPPGDRTLKFTYRLPIDQRRKVFERTVDLPCSRVRVTVRGADAGEVSSNLPPLAAAEAGATVFESADGQLPPGRRMQLKFGRLPTPWMTYARWISLAILAGLILATTCWRSKLSPLARSQMRADQSQIRSDKIPQIR
jgi:hypothetical protein